MRHRFPLLVFMLALTVQPAGAMWVPSYSDFMTCSFEQNETRDVCAEWIDVHGNVAGFCCVPLNEIGNPFTMLRPENCPDFFFRPTGAGSVGGGTAAPLSADPQTGQLVDETGNH